MKVFAALMTVPGFTAWTVTTALVLQQFIADTLWLLRRRRARQPGLNTEADADAFVEELHTVAATEPLSPLEHNETSWRMPYARTTPLVAELAAETRRIQMMTLTRTEIVCDTCTPIYDAVVRDMRRRRDQAERRQRALEDPTGEFRQIVSACLFEDAYALIGRPPQRDRRSVLVGAVSGVEAGQPEVTVP